MFRRGGVALISRLKAIPCSSCRSTGCGNYISQFSRKKRSVPVAPSSLVILSGGLIFALRYDFVTGGYIRKIISPRTFLLNNMTSPDKIHDLPESAPAQVTPETTRISPATVRFYNYLRINWKFSLVNQYILAQLPSSDNAAATYQFTSSTSGPSQPVKNAFFGISQGLSRNFYKQYTITISFHGMFHREALEYFAKHETSPEMLHILETYCYSILF